MNCRYGALLLYLFFYSANSDYVSLTEKFNVYYETVKNETEKTMNVANPSIWMCDPDFYMKGEL